MKKNNKVWILLLLVVAFISIGYAALATELKINGTAGISKKTWDVHFTNLVVNEDSVAPVEGKGATIVKDDAGNDTKVTYTVNLAEPGDFYEFTVDVTNAGTLPAKLTAIKGGTLPEGTSEAILYTVTYVNGDNDAVAVDDVLDSEATNTIKIRVEYDPNVSPTVLDAMPEEGIKDLELTYELDYAQN